MARRRNNRRRRRGRLSFLWRPLGAVVAVAAMVAAAALFFRMDHIVVSGNERYAEQEVLDASGLELGSNLYLLNKYAVKEAIFTRLPYVEEVRINRKLPDTLVIEVSECEAAAAVEEGNGVWLISANGKLLERANAAGVGCPLLTGERLVEPEVSAQADFGAAAAYRANVALTLLREADSRGMRDKIERIDLADETALNFGYLYRFAVRIPWTADVGYKLESLATVVDYLEVNETGRIDLMTDGKASFIPQ